MKKRVCTHVYLTIRDVFDIYRISIKGSQKGFPLLFIKGWYVFKNKY